MTGLPANTARPSFYTVFATGACLALGTLVVVLAKQNRQLKSELEHALASTPPPSPRAAGDSMIGRAIQPVTGIDAAGSESTIALDSPGRQIVMIGSVHCPTCLAVRPYWHEVGHWAVSAKIPARCLLTDERPGPLDAETLGVPVHQIPNFRESSLGSLPLVPAILLMKDGVVTHAWLGEPAADQREQVMAALAAP